MTPAQIVGSERALGRDWQRIIGCSCIAFVYRPHDEDVWHALPLPGEITGIEGEYVYVVLDDEEEPRRLHWCDVRPR